MSTIAQGVENTEVNYLDMSDEDLLNATPPDTTISNTAATVENTSSDTESENDSESNEDTTEEASTATAEDTSNTENLDSVPGDDDAGAAAKPQSKPEASEPASDQKAAQETNEVKDTNAPTINYEEEYNKLLAPFKANGRDMQIQGIDDARTLMQMGANYNKKMAAMKPHLKVLKVLEQNGLLDETKLSFLIDLSKNNPGAINKLVKDSGIDPMEIDTDKAGDYKQTTYTVDDREIALDTVLGELEHSPAYTQTLDIVGNKWDAQSKQIIADQPEILRVINSHVETGIYDLIKAEVEREKMFGRLTGLSDIQAYRAIGDAINARGGFDHLMQKSANNVQSAPAPTPVVVAPKNKPADDDRLNDKRRAAGSTKPVVTSSMPSADFNPLSMSDEEFAKQGQQKFL